MANIFASSTQGPGKCVSWALALHETMLEMARLRAWARRGEDARSLGCATDLAHLGWKLALGGSVG
jgi:hypothetical protein